jgi:hypothetical protein
MRLISCVELDPRTIMLTVLEQLSEKRVFRSVLSERQRHYSLQVGVGRWHDGEHFILNNDPRHFRLMELLQKHRLEQKLDEYIGLESSKPRLWLGPAHVQREGPLPPVPFLAPRARLPRR